MPKLWNAANKSTNKVNKYSSYTWMMISFKKFKTLIYVYANAKPQVHYKSGYEQLLMTLAENNEPIKERTPIKFRY